MYNKLGSTYEEDFESIVNNKNFKNIRKSFLNNKFPKECYSCSNFEKETGKIASVRKDSNNFGEDNIVEALQNTQSDGYMEKQFPTMLDLLWTNKCNFACLGCSSTLSSTIALNYNDAYALAHGCTSQEMTNDLWYNNNDNKIDYIIKHKDTIQKIHLNGGEPFLQEDVHELLEVMIKHGLHKKIKIWSHTNGSISKYKGKDIIEDYLKDWPAGCEITMSHDGHGKQGEYVRYGLKQEKWLKTMNRLKEADIFVTIQTSYSIFNALHLVDLHNWYDENTHVPPFERSLIPWHDPLPFTGKFLNTDKELFHRANQQLQKLEGILPNNGWRNDIPSIKNFLQSAISHKDVINGKIRFYKSIKKFDELRGTNFVETFPELADFYWNCAAKGSNSDPHF
jgi:organic radical activating enzyme